MNVIMLVIGVITGISAFLFIMIIKSIGTLVVGNPDENGIPYLYLELNKDVEYIGRKRLCVFLKIRHENAFPRK